MLYKLPTQPCRLHDRTIRQSSVLSQSYHHDPYYFDVVAAYNVLDNIFRSENLQKSKFILNIKVYTVSVLIIANHNIAMFLVLILVRIPALMAYFV